MFVIFSKDRNSLLKDSVTIINNCINIFCSFVTQKAEVTNTSK
jgi:hypothetical protein